jgi:hypothetical protein
MDIRAYKYPDAPIKSPYVFSPDRSIGLIILFITKPCRAFSSISFTFFEKILMRQQQTTPTSSLKKKEAHVLSLKGSI